MKPIRHEFIIDATAEQIVEAVCIGEHIQRWWTNSATLKPVIGAVGTFRWKSRAWEVTIKLEELNSRSVRWTCITSNMQGTNAWVGTDMIFRIEASTNGSKLSFSHEGYQESPCKEVCTDGWRFVLGTSLKQYLENGTGKPQS